MKCPKCSYLGFETGDRCKNCGYDFSLMAPDESYGDELDREPVPDFDIRSDLHQSDADAPSTWLDDFDGGLSTPAADRSPGTPRMMLAEPDPESEPAASPSLPPVDDELAPPPSEQPAPAPSLFTRDDDEPLVRLPPAPRPPLAVRRTPDSPVQPGIGKPVRRQTPNRDHVLLFGEEHDPVVEEPTIDLPEEPAVPLPPIEVASVFDGLRPSGVQPRVVAALIDHGILLAIDLAVVYFTLRMASLTFGDWARLPPLPMLAFLLLVKLAYFSAFTTVGGQTIGKMAAGIRVVADEPGALDLSRALQRAAAVLISLVTLGIGFLPALFTADRRALHDRMARTRVITLPSA